MKRILHFARTMINGKAWSLEVFENEPKKNFSGDHNGVSIMFEGDKMASYWNLELLFPNICPALGKMFVVEIEELEDGSYIVRRIEC